MRSLPSRNIVKDAEERDVQSYDFFAGFLLKKEEEVPEEERILEEPEAEEIEYETLKEEILEEAREQARHIVQEARQQAELLREEAFEEGKKAGEQEGIRSAYEEHRKMLNKELRSFQQNFADVIRDVSIQKDKILEKNIDDLKQISISIAEKVIHTSIRSSEEIIKRMILAAT